MSRPTKHGSSAASETRRAAHRRAAKTANGHRIQNTTDEPALHWRAASAELDASVYLHQLLQVAAVPGDLKLEPIHDGDTTAHLPAAAKSVFIATAMQALKRQYAGRFEVVWVPDDGIPF